MERPTHCPEDYADLLGKDLLLVAGQAVNLWAAFYLSREPALQQYVPLTSKDADLVRVSPTFSTPPGWRLVTFPRKGRMRLVLKALVGPKEQMAEIIQSVHGLSIKELETGIVSIRRWERDILVLSPIRLFKAKASNLRDIDQAHRQDRKHLEMMTIVSRCFLQDLLAAEQTTERPKSTLKALNDHLRTLHQFHELEPLRGSAWDRFFPMALLEAHPSEAVRNFHARLTASVLQ